jgi:hypothetical protein
MGGRVRSSPRQYKPDRRGCAPSKDDKRLLRPGDSRAKEQRMLKRSVLTIIVLTAATLAHAQDVPGIEICTAERDMARRTGCLQSNVDYLHKLIAKNNATAQQQLAAAYAEIATLKASVAALQASVEKLQATANKPNSATTKPAATATGKPEEKSEKK